MEKQQTMPSQWLQNMYSNVDTRKNYCEKHLLGDVPESMAEFEGFFMQRKALLRQQIGKLLQHDKEGLEPVLDGTVIGEGTE